MVQQFTALLTHRCGRSPRLRSNRPRNAGYEESRVHGDYDSTDATKFDSLPQGLAVHPGRTTTSVDQPFSDQALLHEPEIGSYQNRPREYDPAKSRFMQRDPIGYIDGKNGYAYARFAPSCRVDPYGLRSLCGHCPSGCLDHMGFTKCDYCPLSNWGTGGGYCVAVDCIDPCTNFTYCGQAGAEAHESYHVAHANCVPVECEPRCVFGNNDMTTGDEECNAYKRGLEEMYLCLGCPDGSTDCGAANDEMCDFNKCMLLEICGQAWTSQTITDFCKNKVYNEGATWGGCDGEFPEVPEVPEVPDP